MEPLSASTRRSILSSGRSGVGFDPSSLQTKFLAHKLPDEGLFRVVLMTAPAPFKLSDKGWGYSQGVFMLHAIQGGLPHHPAAIVSPPK